MFYSITYTVTHTDGRIERPVLSDLTADAVADTFRWLTDGGYTVTDARISPMHRPDAVFGFHPTAQCARGAMADMVNMYGVR